MAGLCPLSEGRREQRIKAPSLAKLIAGIYLFKPKDYYKQR